MLGHGAAQSFDNLTWMRKRLRGEHLIDNYLRHAACKQIDVRAPSLQRGLPARRRDIGVVEADRCAEDLERARHDA